LDNVYTKFDLIDNNTVRVCYQFRNVWNTTYL